ncbi:MAG: J domain-containing protein [Firmicutes bacterium]|nr:J domain-containing protein [Bacillota bacterium]
MSARGRQYSGSWDDYARKLERVMERWGVETGQWDWDHNRRGAWVTMLYRGRHYQFQQTVDQAEAKGLKISYGIDCFAQVVLGLESLAHLAERGIFDLATLIMGYEALPEARPLPECLVVLGFDAMPSTVEEVKARFRQLVKTAHPDQGGDSQQFLRIHEAASEAEELIAKGS